MPRRPKQPAKLTQPRPAPVRLVALNPGRVVAGLVAGKDMATIKAEQQLINLVKEKDNG